MSYERTRPGAVASTFINSGRSQINYFRPKPKLTVCNCNPYFYQDAPTPTQWTVFASRRQGFTPTLRLVQNPVNGRQTP